MAAWRFTICCHPKSRWLPSEHMHQSVKIRDWRNTAEVSRRGVTGPEAGTRQATRNGEHGQPLVALFNSLPRSQGTQLGEPRVSDECTHLWQLLKQTEQAGQVQQHLQQSWPPRVLLEDSFFIFPPLATWEMVFFLKQQFHTHSNSSRSGQKGTRNGSLKKIATISWAAALPATTIQADMLRRWCWGPGNLSSCGSSADLQWKRATSLPQCSIWHWGLPSTHSSH